MEDSSVENAIEWLAQTILASLLIGSKLVEWIGKVGLGHDIEGLKSEVERVKTMVSALKERATRSKTVAEALVPLREHLYDADDVVDELDYWWIQQQLEGADERPQHEISRENTDGHGALGGRLRSTVYQHFTIKTWDKEGRREESECKYCHQGFGKTSGTSTFKTHLKRCTKKPSSSDDQTPSTGDTLAAVTTRDNSSSRKRLRVEESAHGTTRDNTSSWNKDDLSNRIQHITRQLQNVQQKVRGILMILGSDSGASSNHRPSTASGQSRRTSSLVQRKVYGRTAEKESIIELITEHKSATGVTVVPIVGIGGVGKTALAQIVYNDPEVIRQFDHRIWIWVSSNFDELRVTREMLQFVSKETHEGPCSYAQLQEVLKCHIKSKRVLLVLDDVWDDKNDCRWNQLLAPFKSVTENSNSILLTTRKLSVAKRRGTAKTIKLDALDKKEFWLLFKACAFGDENYQEQASLSDLGQKIARQLQGNPLAAHTAGTLLKDHLTVDHWNNILKTEDWKSLQHCGGIMSALKLSYDELPYPLQQCFSYCSIFPCNYWFVAEDIVRIWISQGFVKCNNSSKRLVEIGRNYLTELVNLGFFEEIQTGTGTSYAMCELMHDFAKIASRTECVTMDGLHLNEILPTVNHFSVVTSSVYQRDDQTGNICRSEKFEEQLRHIFRSVRKLRTFVLIGQYDSFFFEAFQEVFRKEHNLRVLQMSAAHSDFQSFLCSLGNPTHLRYLRVQEGHAGQVALPHIQVLDVHLYSDARLASLHTVHLADCGGWRILPSLENLPFLTRLKLSNMHNLKELSVPSLEELILFNMPDLERCSCTYLEDLKSNLRVLEIQYCPALKLFDLFQNGDNCENEHMSWLPSLRILIIHDCLHLQVLTPLPPSATFSELSITRVSTLLSIEGSSMDTLKIRPYDLAGSSSNDSAEKITLDDKILAFHNLRNIQQLEISYCRNLKSISFKAFTQLMSLKVLKISLCGNLSFSDVVPHPTNSGVVIYPALPSLQTLFIYDSGITGKWLSLMLLLARTLKELELCQCRQLTLLQIEGDGNIQSNLMSASEASSGYQDDSLPISAADELCRIPMNLVSSLKKIKFSKCPRLLIDGSREGFARFTSLEELTISDCPNLLRSDGPANGRWLLPESLALLSMSNFNYEENILPCFVGDATCLKRLEVSEGTNLKSLQLQSCTAMEVLQISRCRSLVALEGMQSLGSLRDLTLRVCPALAPLATLGESYDQIAGISSQNYDLFPRLEKLWIDDVSLLTTSFFRGVACLRSLIISFETLLRLTVEQERVLLLPRSLQKLEFNSCYNLVHLPAGLHSLPSLRTLKIRWSPNISRLPKEGLPPSLEKLNLMRCSDKLSRQCRSLATSKLLVKIDGRYVN